MFLGKVSPGWTASLFSALLFIIRPLPFKDRNMKNHKIILVHKKITLLEDA